MKREWYGVTRWHPSDVVAAAASNGITLTLEQAITWWEDNEESYKARMVELGNEVIVDMLI